jgi:hypothetical protein
VDRASKKVPLSGDAAKAANGLQSERCRPGTVKGVNEIMNTIQPILSAQMFAVLRLLDRENLTTRQLNDRLFDPTSPQSRRVFAASMSRTLRRLARRVLIFREGGMNVISQCGRYKVHPEMHEAMLNDIFESVRQAIEQARIDQPKPSDAPNSISPAPRPKPKHFLRYLNPF